MSQRQIDFISGKVFRINKEVSSDILQNLTVVAVKKFRTVNSCHSLLCPESFRYCARRQIACLVGSHGNIQVGVVDTDVAQRVERGCRSVPSHQVVVVVDYVQP